MAKKNKQPVADRRYIHVVRFGLIDCDEHEGQTPEQMMLGPIDMFETVVAHKDAPYPVALAVQSHVNDAVRKAAALMQLDGIAAFELKGGQVPDPIKLRIAETAGIDIRKGK